MSDLEDCRKPLEDVGPESTFQADAMIGAQLGDLVRYTLVSHRRQAYLAAISQMMVW